jgi:hypothetical protein
MSAAGITIRAGSSQLFAAGDAVWAVGRPTVSLADGSAVEMRLTLVTTEQDGQPLIRHFHMSSGAPNEELLGEELTTQ